jgi:hypothetical protein
MGNCFKKEKVTGGTEKQRQLATGLLGRHYHAHRDAHDYEQHDILGSITDEHNTVTIAVSTATPSTKKSRGMIAGVSSFLVSSINTIKETGLSVLRRNGSSNSNLSDLSTFTEVATTPPQPTGDASLYLELSRLRRESDKLEKHLEGLRTIRPPPSDGATYIGSFPYGISPSIPSISPISPVVPSVVVLPPQVVVTALVPPMPLEHPIMPASMIPYADSMLYHSAMDAKDDPRDGHSTNNSASNSDSEGIAPSVADSYLEHVLEGSELNGSFGGSRLGYSPGPMPPPLPKSLKGVKYNRYG